MTAAAAVTIFVVAYALIASERIHRTAVALGGAALMLLLHITDARAASSPSTPASTGTSSSCCWA
ncbi:hypothetical protein [Actinomadura terrae]|uniref:hypothetical protein n=1 Tax=Actinomadura terrae TaxID=604353 RepID=UPI001FA7BE4F|nr:hypothetical protein [Actinomadura terrae]